MSSVRALLIVNRRSRDGNADLDRTVQVLREHDVELIESYPTEPAQVGAAIRSHAARIDCVIIGGGDGTLNAAAPALLSCGVPLGILPLGTANDLARTLGIPSDTAQATEVILHGGRQAIDLGRVNQRYFFNAAHIGLAVTLTRRMSSEVKRRWGVAAYAHAAARAVRENRAFRARIRADGELLPVRSIQITVGNGRHYGGGMTVAPDARIDDHYLDLYSLAPQPWWRLLQLTHALRRGTHGAQQGVLLRHGRRFEVHTRRRMPVVTDGELTTHTPARFDVVPAALQVLVPPTRQPGRPEARHVAQ